MSGLKGGEVEIRGETYAAAVKRLAESFNLTPRGKQLIQVLKVSISKALLIEKIPQGETIKYQGQGFKIDEVLGHDEHDATWHFTASRQPGKDDS